MHIALVGLGLIGGSLAKCIKKHTPHTVLGTDICEQVVYQAKLLEAIDGELTPERLGICNMVIVAAWPEAAVEYVKTHSDFFMPGALVMDVCGVKSEVCRPLWKLAEEKGFTFVGGHPMAGIEYSGFAHASSTLFDNASMILTPPPNVEITMLSELKQFWRDLGFGKVVITTPEEHDEVIAYTSQLPHVLSSAFIKSPAAQLHLGFSAGSFKDMSRVAKLNEEMWTELFLANRQPLLSELDLFMANLSVYRTALEAREQKEAADRKDGIA